MKQEVDVMTVFKKGERQPRPLKFRMMENGVKYSVDVVDILRYDYRGTNRIDYECNAVSSKGNMINYVLQYYRNEARWILEIK